MTALVHIHISNPRHQCAKSSTLAENPAWYDNITQDTACEQCQEDFYCIYHQVDSDKLLAEAYAYAAA